MTNDKNLKDIASAMYDHRFVTVNLTNGQSVNGRISGLAGTSFKIGLTPQNCNRFNIERVESIKIH